RARAQACQSRNKVMVGVNASGSRTHRSESQRRRSSENAVVADVAGHPENTVRLRACARVTPIRGIPATSAISLVLLVIVVPLEQVGLVVLHGDPAKSAHRAGLEFFEAAGAQGLGEPLHRAGVLPVRLGPVLPAVEKLGRSGLE